MPELLFPKSPGTIVPNSALQGLAGPSAAPVTNITINAQGAYPESIADIKAALAAGLAETNASIPQTAISAYQQARDRGVV